MKDKTTMSVHNEDMRRFIMLKAEYVAKTGISVDNADFFKTIINSYEKRG